MGSHGPIGVFDSGIGGLTVVREIKQQLPQEKVVYFGDTAHVPYGPRPPAELIGFAQAITRFLISQGVVMVIAACNTTSSLALDYLRQQIKLTLLGVVEPGCRQAAAVTHNGRVGVIATEATINSGAHACLLKQFVPDLQVIGQACPQFVPLVEAGKINGAEVRAAAASYLSSLRQAGIDTLILGCTHYPFLAPLIQDILGPQVQLIDPAAATVAAAKQILAGLGIPGLYRHTPDTDRFYVSGPTDSFYQVGQQLVANLSNIQKVYPFDD